VTARAIVEAISIDTQVFVATGYGFSSKSFQSLKSHFASGRLNLVMTDITVREVHARIKQSVAEELVGQRSFINNASALFNSSIPEVKICVTKLDPQVVAKNLCDQFDAFLQEAKATIIETKDLPPGDVLAKYFAGDPPFGDAENKRHEFPDAFSIQALAEWAEGKDLKMFVVSRDKHFQDACAECPHFLPKKTLIEVLDHVASDDAQLARFVRAETMKRIAAIRTEVKKEFEDRYYWVEDEDGDAEVRITKLTRSQEPEIIEIDKEEAVLQLTFDALYSANLSYDDSSTASYDEGTLVYVEHKKEDVEREQELVVEVRVAYEQGDSDSFEITGISLTEPSDGFGIATQDDYDWPYK
jgi:hypothetical protein